MNPALLVRLRMPCFDVDGTLIDAVDHQRLVRRTWAEGYGLEGWKVLRSG